jgi:hypothetical protein
MSKRFTLAEAEKLLPEVEKDLRKALAQKSQYEEADTYLNSISQRVTMLGGVVIDRDSIVQQKTKRDRAAEQLKAAVESILETGCLIKDLDIGLVDFPTLFRGEEVYLCWKLGEVDIRFWHGVQEGFKGRKPIDQDFIDNHGH